MDRQGNIPDGEKYTPRDAPVVYCIALTLIEINSKKMEQENIAYLHMSKVPEVEAKEIKRD